MNQQGEFFGECLHQFTDIVPVHAGPHHGKVVCSHCRKFIRWIPKPETVKQQKKNRELLTALCKRELTEWERDFIRDLSSLKRLSPRQQENLNVIAAKYLEAAP